MNKYDDFSLPVQPGEQPIGSLKRTLESWKHLVYERYNACAVVRSNSFAAWGYNRTKIKVATIKSPWGATYNVYQPKPRSK